MMYNEICSSIHTTFFVFKNKTLNVLKIGYLRVCCKCFKFPKLNIKIIYVLHHLQELESVAVGFQKNISRARDMEIETCYTFQTLFKMC